MAQSERRESDHDAWLEAKSIVRAMKNGVDFTDELNISELGEARLHAMCGNDFDRHIVKHALDYRAKVRGYVEQIIASGKVPDAEAEELEAEVETPTGSLTIAEWLSASGEEEPRLSEAEA